MKKFTALFLCVLLLAPLAYAEILCTANPAGQGKWIFEGSAASSAKVNNVSDRTATGYSVVGVYGLNNQLDFVGVIGSTGYGGTLGTGITGMSAMAYAAALKYSIVRESSSMPVSLAASLGYTSLSLKTDTAAGSATTNGSNTGIKLIASKMMLPFIPYGALAYNSLSLGSDATSIDLTLGSAFGLSRTWSMLLEYTLQSWSASGTNYSGSQIAFGIGYLP
jgi:hypothetical protein